MENKPDNKKKTILIVVAAVVGLCIISIVVACLVLRMAGDRIQKSVSSDPAVAAKTAHAIADYDLPSGYAEQTAMDLLVTKMVSIVPTDHSGRPIIMLAQMAAAANVSPEQLAEQMQQQSSWQATNMRVVETRSMTIRGAQTKVVISEGADQDGNAMRQLSTAFPGKSGQAMLIIMGSVDAWDQAALDAFLGSIR